MQQNILLPEYPYAGSTGAGRIYAEQYQLCIERALPGMRGKSSKRELIALLFYTAFPDLQMGGNNYLFDSFIPFYLFYQQTAGCFTHQVCLMRDGRQFGLYIIGMLLIYLLNSLIT